MPPRELFNLVSNYYHLWKHLYLVIMTTPFLTKTSTLNCYKYWTLYLKPGNSNPPDLTYAQFHIHLKIISDIFLTLITHTHLTIVLLLTSDASSFHIFFILNYSNADLVFYRFFSSMSRILILIRNLITYMLFTYSLLLYLICQICVLLPTETIWKLFS